MPYGIKGGDTPASTAWMQKCVTDVQASGKSKLSAILICKSAYGRRKKGAK